jgi:hypothetical protein
MDILYCNQKKVIFKLFKKLIDLKTFNFINQDKLIESNFII